MRKVLALIVPIVLLAALPALGSNATVTATASNTFQPQTVTISVGEKVTWVNSGGGFHNVVLDDGSFRNGDPSSSSWTAEHTFTTAGSFAYHCEVHGASGMTGTVVVVEPTATPTPTATTTPSPTPTPTPTAAPPAAKQGVSGLRVQRALKRGRLLGSVRSTPGKLQLTVSAPKRVVGRGFVRVTKTGRVAFRVHLSAFARKRLARRHRLRVTVVVMLHEGVYTVAATARRVTLRTS